MTTEAHDRQPPRSETIDGQEHVHRWATTMQLGPGYVLLECTDRRRCLARWALRSDVPYLGPSYRCIATGPGPGQDCWLPRGHEGPHGWLRCTVYGCFLAPGHEGPHEYDPPVEPEAPEAGVAVALERAAEAGRQVLRELTEALAGVARAGEAGRAAGGRVRGLLFEAPEARQPIADSARALEAAGLHWSSELGWPAGQAEDAARALWHRGYVVVPVEQAMAAVALERLQDAVAWQAEGGPDGHPCRVWNSNGISGEGASLAEAVGAEL